MARCGRCDQEYAPLLQVNDLIEVERELGYRYECGAADLGGATNDAAGSAAPHSPNIDHYQRICPACRRSMVAIAQGQIWHGHTA